MHINMGNSSVQTQIQQKPNKTNEKTPKTKIGNLKAGSKETQSSDT
jgi:hypothetical protein